jgi:hypothetical protein
MEIIIAKIKRYFHCLLRLHQAETYWIDNKIARISCICGKTFYDNKIITGEVADAFGRTHFTNVYFNREDK